MALSCAAGAGHDGAGYAGVFAAGLRPAAFPAEIDEYLGDCV
ncbi:hypothetical protein SDC9_199332 [bioreactor metagenome]|uniref:Uncharacterized protein n=1 Tax=bioreactor metagenome TaxID=1076179 RepID=A0A645IWX2_9ZZZZ